LNVGQTGVGCCVLDLPWFLFQSSCAGDAVKLESDEYRSRPSHSEHQMSSAASSTQQHDD